MYNMLASIIKERTYSFLDTSNILWAKQKGRSKVSYSSKDQFLINKMLLENSRSNHRNLSTAWIHYRKTFDSGANSGILKVL